MKYYFNLWRKNIKIIREYNLLIEIKEDLQNEIIYARNNKMDSVHSDCQEN